MLSDLFFVRHGPTHQTAFTGWRDVAADLSDTDVLARLDAALPATAHVVSSDLQRAVSTADSLCRARPRLPHETDLREFDFGAWDGLHFDEVAQRDPALSRQLWEQPGDIAAPGGESWNMVARRVATAIERLDGTLDGPLVAVAHFGTVLTFLSTGAGLSVTEALGHRIDPLSITHLARVRGRWRVVSINRLP